MAPLDEADRVVEGARRALREGRPRTACELLSGAVREMPRNVEAWRLMGRAARLAGRCQLAAEALSHVLELTPNDASACSELGAALFLGGRRRDAIVTLRRACSLDPSSASAWFNLGEAEKTDPATVRDAIDAFEHAVALEARNARAWVSLGRVRSIAGNTSDAALAFREAIRVQPHNAWAWFGLSELNVIRFTPADVTRLRALYCGRPESGIEHCALGFALAKAYECNGAYEDAFRTFVEVNELHRRRVTWSAVVEHNYLQSIRRMFMSRPFDAAVKRDSGCQVVFVTSLPRSGSSLIEHILASHSLITGAGEITSLSEVLTTESRRRGCAFPAWVSETSAGDWHRMGLDYLARTQRWRVFKSVFVDKYLDTWKWIGAVMAMLPAARVVIVRRDPVETCLSCFRQLFARNVDFAYSLDELADHYIEFTRTVDFWIKLFPDQVYNLDYDALLRDPRPTLKRLFAFCGLDFEERCLDFYKTSRMVGSLPSAAQVRQPLHHSAMRSIQYGKCLDALRARLRAGGVHV